MVAFILFMLATAGVKGFAFTLGVGTIVSLFTAVLPTQAILGTLGRSRLLRRRARSAPASERHAGTFDFMGASKWFFSMSGVILLDRRAGHRRQGHQLRHRLRVGHADHDRARAAGHEDQVRDVLAEPGYGDAKIQRVDEPELGRQRLPDLDRDARARAGRRGRAGARRAVRRRGSRLLQQLDRPDVRRDRSRARAIIAIIASLLVISAYIALRFEWKYAVPVLIALVARPPDHGGRLRAGRPGGDDVDGRGAAHHPGLLALRHDHRVRPNPRERAAHAAGGVLADRQPLDVRGADPVAGDELLHRCCRSPR